jgi:hypothetical protein
MTIERHQYPVERLAIYDQCWLEEQQILKALKCIDRVRAKLIEAQNDLVTVINGADDITREKFTVFYNGGGVTAKDWQDELGTGKYQDANKIARGQLRLVASQERRQPIPLVRRRRAGPDDAA